MSCVSSVAAIEFANRMHQPRLWWIAASAACTVCVAGSLVNAQRPAQDRQPQTTFRASIELVQIDAVVVDEQGRHVRGLTAKDFVIFDRGRRQAIAAFEEVTHRRAAASASGMRCICS